MIASVIIIIIRSIELYRYYNVGIVFFSIGMHVCVRVIDEEMTVPNKRNDNNTFGIISGNEALS